MRAFVAVFPPPEVQKALVEAARVLPPNAFRLTAPERVHLTLKFLGEVLPEDLSRLARALEPVARHAEPFDACTSALGVFPSERRARILWSGIGEGATDLVALAHTVDSLLEPEGFAREERPFVPHLTLGRARRPTPFDPTSANPPKLRFAVRKIDLVQSGQHASGVTYSTLAEYEL